MTIEGKVHIGCIEEVTMKIDANSQALSKILTMESREFYHIPPYQRSYSWKNE